MKKLCFLTEIIDKIRSYHGKINWIVFILVIIFGVASWIDINGMWCELPLMVHELPEGWRLPAIITLVTQIAQIGPFGFIILKWLFPKRISYVVSIYIILGVGIISCLLLYFFWNKTLIIGNEERSIGLYILTFTLGLLDGTSTVTFLAYIGTNFNKEYIIPNYIGESFSSMIPSIAGMIQGIGKDMGCRNISFNYTIGNTNNRIIKYKLEPIPLVPTFSVSIFYIFLFVLLCISTVAFTLLNYLPLSKRAKRKTEKEMTAANSSEKGIEVFVSKDVMTLSEKEHYTNTLSEVEENEKSAENATNTSSKMNIVQPEEHMKENLTTPTKKERILLYLIVNGCTFLVYGVLPSIQSYSTLPYGNDIFHASINIGFFLLPFATFFSIWSYKLTTLRISIEFLIAVALSIYIIVISTFSPCLPLLNSWLGPALILFAWIVSQNMFMRVRCCIAAKLEECGEDALIIVGGCTMLGQCIGAIIMYVIVDVYRLFKDVPVCLNVKEYCLKR